MGFGTTGKRVDAALAQGLPAHVSAALQADPNADPGARSTPLPRYTPPARAPKGASKAQMHAVNTAIGAQLESMTRWWLRRMAAVEQPAHEKLTLLWHNHFSTSAQKVRDASMMVAQNEKLRDQGLGDFHTLAYTMLTDPAMLRWLDGQQNTAKAPNENLAREFMELFALGHGNGYTETDVRQGARALTGWVIRSDGTAAFERKRHDPGIKTVLGVTGPLDAAGYCDAVLDRPEAPGYLVARMWQQFGSITPPSAAASARLVGAYGARRDLTAMVQAILLDPEATAPHTSGVSTPVEWLIGAVRSLQVPMSDDKQVMAFASGLRRLGQLPFYPPSVGGWPAGQAWLSTAAAETRLALAQQLVHSADLDAVAGAGRRDRVDALGYQLGIGAWSDRSAAVLGRLAHDPRRMAAAALNTPEYLTV